MKKYNYKINPDSIFISSLINILYLIPLLLGLVCINMFYNELNLKLLISLLLLYICLSELFHRFIISKWNIINLIYKLKNKITKLINEYMYFILNKIFGLLNIIFVIFSFIFLLGKINVTTSNFSNIYSIVPNIITIASIILTLILALLQYFSNRFPDFIDLLVKWKKNTILLFTILVVYSLISFTAIYFKEFTNINFWIYITSIFLVFQLCLLGCEAILLMNDTGIIHVKTQNIIRQINKFPAIVTRDELLSNINKISKPPFLFKIKNYFKYNLLGIITDKNYDLSEYFSMYIKQDLDALFRIANIYILKDNLILFKSIISSINEILQQLIIKNRGVEHFNIYEYFAAKQKLLFYNLIKYEREEYFIILKDLNVSTIKKLIISSSMNYNSISCSQSISFFVEQLEDIILRTSGFKHTTVTNNAIANLHEIANYLLNKNDINITISIIKTLENIAITIDKLYKSKKWDINKIWTATIIGQTLYAQVNIIFYSIMNAFEANKPSYKDLLEQANNSYLITFKILSNYAMLNCHPINTLYSLPKQNYEMLYNFVARNEYVKTPYKNMVLKGLISHINTVSCLAEVFGHVFISDFDDSQLFERAISNLFIVLDMIVSIPLDNLNCVSCDEIIDFFEQTMQSAFIFEKRVTSLKYHLKNYSQITNDFLAKLLNASYISFEKLYKKNGNNFINKYICFLTKFLNCTKATKNSNIKLEKLIYNKINDIVDLFIKENDDNIKKIMFCNIKFLCIKLFEISKRNKKFKHLYKFIQIHEKDFPTFSNEFCSIWESEGLPHNSEYLLNGESLKKYILYKRKHH